MSDKTFPCRDCGKPVAWRTSKAGKRYLGQPARWRIDSDSSHNGGSHEKTWWPSHDCTPDPEWRDRAAREEADRIAAATAAGILTRGVRAEVYKGRKVPIGTIGFVFWVADEPDSFDVVRVGMTTDAGEKVFVNSANLRVVNPSEA
jgi:hypothetical protein